MAWFVLNCWLRELPLSTIATCLGLRFQSRSTDAIYYKISSCWLGLPDLNSKDMPKMLKDKPDGWKISQN